MIVDEITNLFLAVPVIVFGAMGTADQRCTSTRRVGGGPSCTTRELEGLLMAAYQWVKIDDPLQEHALNGFFDR